jgi:hypothetical protein
MEVHQNFHQQAVNSYEQFTSLNAWTQYKCLCSVTCRILKPRNMSIFVVAQVLGLLWTANKTGILMFVQVDSV